MKLLVMDSWSLQVLLFARRYISWGGGCRGRALADAFEQKMAVLSRLYARAAEANGAVLKGEIIGTSLSQVIGR